MFSFSGNHRVRVTDHRHHPVGQNHPVLHRVEAEGFQQRPDQVSPVHVQVLPLVSGEVHALHQPQRLHRLRDQKHQLLLFCPDSLQLVSLF